ncbi:SDR family oxidoreductase [Streptomyces sp. 3211]|uniref:SDR family oxidoreductase n=1 Tax=Streptomyces sp. 3211 TaxID=1964449 RepID=UPI0009A49F6C|nr:SDR family NAD(P)-dependent oxidoreductase [Streptomyces sp. 3211]
MNVHGRTILVTGGARGVGRELTRQLVGLDARVVAVGRDRDQLESLSAEHDGRVSTHVVDLADPEATGAFADEIVHLYPDLSGVVNNAGVQTLIDFFRDDPHTTRPVLRREIAVNLEAVVTLSTALLPHLSRQSSAAIVNVTSGLALTPKPSAPVYCATKAAVRTFTRALRYQCQDAAPHIRVIDAILPLVDTDMTRGRGGGKISAAQAAGAVITGIRRDTTEIYIGKTKLLRTIMRLSPSLGYRILRNG